jgi:glycosyltransferase involved in cell wall biosynthesis
MKRGSMDLSIIITVYNQQHYLERALLSCLRQHIEALEIIVVDDGSEPAIVLPSLDVPSHVTLRLLSKSNGGVASARNLGISEAQGHFIKFLDCDDELLPECCSLQLSSLEPSRAELSIIGYKVLQADKWVQGIPKFDTLLQALFQGNVAPLHSFMYRTEDVRMVGGFDETERTLQAMEDYDFNFRLALAGVNAVTVHQTGVLYHRLANSRSSNTNKVHSANVRILLNAIETVVMSRSRQVCLLDLLQGIALLAVQSQDFCSFIKILPSLRQMVVESSQLMVSKFSLQVQSRLEFAKHVDEKEFWILQKQLLSEVKLDPLQSLSPPGYALRPASPPLAAHYFDGVLLAKALAKASGSKALWLWGTGMWADYWLGMLGSFGVQPVGFIDSFVSDDGTTYKGLPCLGLSKVPDHLIEHVIICSRDSYFTIMHILSERQLDHRILHYVTI